MSKFTKRIAAMVLAAAMLASTAAEVFAAGSPTQGVPTPTPAPAPTTTIVTAPTSKDNEVSVTGASSVSDTLFIAGIQENKVVSAIASGTVSDKQYATITFEVYKRTKWGKNVLKGNAKKTKTVIITKASDAKKLVAKKFNAKAFKGFKGKIIVKKAAMTKKQFNKLKAKLKKGGFKGKISYKK